MNTRPRKFLPGVYGGDIPMAPITPNNATGGNGPLAGQTAFFDLNLVNFDWITWHDYEWENWIQVDALLNAAIGFLNLRGIWRPQTEYFAGQTVLDPRDTTKFFLCLQNHTSSTDPAQLDDPLLWEQKQSAEPPVTSVFGRIGVVTAQAADYEAFYLKLAGGTLSGALTMDGGNLRIRNTRTLQFFNAGPTDTVQSQLEPAAAALSMRVFNAAGISPTVYRFRNASLTAGNDDVLRRAEIDALVGAYLPLTGGTVTGNINILDGVFNVTGDDIYDKLQMVRGDRAWVFGMVNAADPLEVVLINGNTPVHAARFDPAGSVVPNALTLITREKGDGRYLQLGGGTLTGAVTMATAAINQLVFRGRAQDSITDVEFRNNAGDAAFRWAIRAQPSTTGGLQFRHNDVSLLQIASTGSLTLGGTAGAVITGPSGVISNGEIQQRSAGNNSIGFRAAAGTLRALLYTNTAQGTPERAAPVLINYYDQAGANARVAASFPDRIANGGALDSSQSVVTREHGDTRYAQPWQVISQHPTTFSGDLNDLFVVNTSATYFVLNGAPNAPDAVNGTLLVQTSPINPLFCSQTFIEVTGGTPRMWVRARANGNWSPWQELATGLPTFGEIAAANVSTSATSIQVTGIPDWANHVEVQISLLSAAATGGFNMRLGTAAGVVSAGYAAALSRLGAAGSLAGTTSAAQFLLAASVSSANSLNTVVKLTRYSGDIWQMTAQGSDGPGNSFVASGRINLSDALTRFTLFTDGSNFTGGGVAVRYWR